MASTLGQTAVQGDEDYNAAHVIVVSGPYTVGSDIKITDGKAWQVPGSSGSQKVRMVVYADNGSGTGPTGAALATSVEANIPASASGSWIPFTFTSPPNLTAGSKVWIGLWWGISVGSYQFQVAANFSAGPGKQQYNLGTTYASTGPAPATTWTVGAVSEYSVYLDMASAGAPQTVTVPSVYPPGFIASITGRVTCGDGHVAYGVPSGQFGAVTATITVHQAVVGLGSAQAFGAVTIHAVDRVGPLGVPSAQAFGAVTVHSATTVPLVGLGTAQSFGAVTVYAVARVPVGAVGSAQAFGVPSARIVQFVSPAGLGSAQAFGALTLRWQQFVSPSGLGSAQAFGTPGTKGAIKVPLGGIPSPQAFGAVSVRYAQPVPVPGLPSAQAFGTSLVVFNVYLHDLDCLDLDLAGLDCLDRELAALVCIDGRERQSICGLVICGDGHLCGGSGYLHTAPAPKSDDLDPLVPRTLALQPL